MVHMELGVSSPVADVAAIDSRQTRNHLIPGIALFNDPTRLYSSSPRNIHLAARLTF